MDLKKTLIRRVSEEELQDDNELQGERIEIAKVKRKILALKYILIENKINYVETRLFLLRKKKIIRSHMIYNLLVKHLWKYKIQSKSCISQLDNDTGINTIEE